MGNPSWKDGFARRLGVYLFGIAIGLMFLGGIQQCKRARPVPQGGPDVAPQPSQQPQITAPEEAESPGE